ncbi:probable adenylyltransferase/sulfurtransferase MoeZ [Arthrobacter sp. Hiyo8]|nr:probable adenylyltransferase/sulfurtransferase MoeZ [Arthrobacter sp. Hiyo8]
MATTFAAQTLPSSLPPLVEPAAGLTTEEVERYSRHLIIPEIGAAGQRRLKNAKVLVIGAGGLGSPALLYLAAAGVGTLGIVDDDDVDLSNLQRQIIHRVGDVGRPKIESARDAIKELNPLVSVQLHNVRLDSSNALEIFSGYDLILDGADNFATRYLVNDAAAILGKPYVWDPFSASTARSVCSGRSTDPATAISTRRPLPPARSRPAAKAACSACCAPLSARSW